MNRREFLECAAILVGGITASRAGIALSEEQLTYLAAAPDYASKSLNYFTPAQRRIVAAMTEVIIPRTDTPGAIEAGVPRFIELMVADWFNDQERAVFAGGLQDMEARIPQKFGLPFDQLDAQQQLSILESLENAAAESPWYASGNLRRDFIGDAPFICMLKELTIWGFFTSEAGASEVLRYKAMPMRFDGHAPLSPSESSWASYMFI